MRSAEDFDQFYAKVDPWGLNAARFRDRALRRAISKYVQGRSVLELGCGEGHLTQALFSTTTSVLGVDLSAIAIARAKKRGLENAQFLVGDILSIPFEGYDVLTAIECLYYLSPDEQSFVLERISNAHRGKIFILSAPIIGERYFTDGDILAKFSKCGMNLIEAVNLTIYWNTLAKRAAGIALKLLPFGNHLIDFVPARFIYQRCYVVRTAT
jgi:SAM-dependent methyltransferase